MLTVLMYLVRVIVVIFIIGVAIIALLKLFIKLFPFIWRLIVCASFSTAILSIGQIFMAQYYGLYVVLTVLLVLTVAILWTVNSKRRKKKKEVQRNQAYSDEKIHVEEFPAISMEDDDYKAGDDNICENYEENSRTHLKNPFEFVTVSILTSAVEAFQKSTNEYVLNKRSGVIHDADDPSADMISERNKRTISYFEAENLVSRKTKYRYKQ